MSIIATGITVADLAAAVSAGLASLPARPQPAIMGAARIDTSECDSTLSIASFDWDSSTTATMSAVDVAQTVHIAVSGRLLAQVVKVAPKRAPLILELDEHALLRIIAGKTVFTLRLMDVDDYPAIPVVDGDDSLVGTVDAATLRAAIDRAATATVKDSDARSTAHCVSIVDESGDALGITGLQPKMVVTTLVDWTPQPGGLDVRIIADELTAILAPFDGGEITIRTNGGLVGLSGATGDDLRIASTCSTFDMPYPAWRKLFTRFESASVLDVGDEFAEAVRRCATLAGAKLPQMRMQADAGAITLTVDGALVDEVAPLGFDGEPVDFTVNPLALRDLTATIGDKVRLRFQRAANRPAHIGPIEGEPDIGAPLPDADNTTECLLMGIGNRSAQ